MSETPREWKYLERRPGSSYQQLCVKGKRIWAWTLYCESFVEDQPRTPEQLAVDWNIPLEAVREAIEYCSSDPPELRDDKRKDDVLREAIGMNEPAIQDSGKPRTLSTEEREARSMRLYVDDDSVDPALIRLLRRDGHDVQVPADIGLVGSIDQIHLAHAIRDRRAILTRNYKDFQALHDLIVSAARGHHEGILVVLFDNNQRNNMSSGDIARAVRNLNNASVTIADSYYELNHWQ